MDDRFPIGEVARRTGLSPHTLRYYERIGLLPGVPRDTGGRRAYRASDLELLEFVRRLRACGMPLKRIHAYVELLPGGIATGRDRLAILLEYEQSIVAQIEELQSHLEQIRYKIGIYRAHARQATEGEG